MLAASEVELRLRYTDTTVNIQQNTAMGRTIYGHKMNVIWYDSFFTATLMTVGM